MGKSISAAACVAFIYCVSFPTKPAHASSGTEGAAFLDIPVGAGPAALGAAYTALANDAYAPTWNPGGLGLLDSPQFSGQHLAYIDTLHYEYVSFAVPFNGPAHHSAIGGSVQYLGSGDIDATDGNGNSLGTYSSHWASYNLSYGRALTDRFSVGMTGKLINAKIDDLSANAYAADLGTMYKARPDLTLAATVTNAGSSLTFLSDRSPLPLAVHAGAAYRPSAHWLLAGEGEYERNGLASMHLGGEWRPLQLIALRVGYRTDTVKELSALAGLTTGIGLRAWGAEFSYAWVPMGDLGNTHYFSLIWRLGQTEDEKNLVQNSGIKRKRSAKSHSGATELDPEEQQLMELLDTGNHHEAKTDDGAGSAVGQ